VSLFQTPKTSRLNHHTSHANHHILTTKTPHQNTQFLQKPPQKRPSTAKQKKYRQNQKKGDPALAEPPSSLNPTYTVA
jgi:hypothetical protein